MRERNRGFVLIIVLALLGVLAFIALELTQRSQVNRNLSQNHLHLAKAGLAARSGLEKAVVGCRTWGWKYGVEPPFEQNIEAAGDDRNRDNALDPFTEDPQADGILHRFRAIENDPTPSMALKDPASSTPLALSINVGNVPTGVTWLDDKVAPKLAATVQTARSVIDLNAGIESGRTSEGDRYNTEFRFTSYDAVSLDHPFNAPLVRLLNAWGNVKKYEAMVQPNKTYDWTREIDDDVNLMPAGQEYVAGPRFDVFYPSERCPGEVPLGNLILKRRPPGGYGSVEEALSHVEDYVRNWRDKAGNKALTGSWLRSTGSADPVIAAITPAQVEAIRNEFRAMAAVNPVRHSVHRPLRGRQEMANSLSPTLGEPQKVTFDNVGWGDHNGQRAVTNIRMFRPRMAILNINAAPPSLVAAALASVGRVSAMTYSIIANPPFTGVGSYTRATAENGHIYFTNPVLDAQRQDPVFSFTESRKMAAILMSRRPLTSYSTLHSLVATWDGGFDGKGTNGPSWPTQSLNYNVRADNKFFLDIFSGFQRGHVLSHLINPHLNLGLFVWDDALPKALDNRINSLGGQSNFSVSSGEHAFATRFMFDKTMGHGTGATFCLDSGDLQVTSLGRSLGEGSIVLASRTLSAGVQVYQVLDVHSQTNWMGACTDPASGASTLAPGDPLATWVSYPEMPGAVPADYDGFLALKPRVDFASHAPWGSALKARVPLTPYESGQNPTRELSGKDIWPAGPRLVPRDTLALRNSLKPAPTDGPLPLCASTLSMIDGVSDLLPGGGLRVWPLHNPSHLPFEKRYSTDPNRKEAILSLRNALVDDGTDSLCPNPSVNPGAVGKVLPSFHEGAVSFYIKPKFTPPSDHSAGPVRDTNQTLFFMPFVIHDEKSFNECLALPAPYNTTASPRRWYVGHIRLNWTQGYWGSGGGAFSFNCLPSTCHSNPALLDPWPYVPPFSGSVQIAAGPHYFANMNGPPNLTYPGDLVSCYTGFPSRVNTSVASRIFASLGVAANWDNAYARITKGVLGKPNPPPSEGLTLELNLCKYAHADFMTVTPDPAYPSVNPTWSTWDALDEMSPLGQACAYVNPAATALHLFDTSGMVPNGLAEYHSVRKCFNLFPPVEYSGAATKGQGPLDSRYHKQAMLAPGRWNHLLIAWRNLFDLLDNSVASHKGGCLAVYVNGHLRTTSPRNHTLAGLFIQTDTSLGFKSGLGSTMAWWEPGFTHPIYNTSFSGRPYSRTFKTYTLPEFGQPPMSDYYAPNFKNPILAFGAARMPSDDPLTLTCAYGQAHSFSATPYSNTLIATMPDLHRSIPSRFYFGCQPINGFDTRGFARKPYLSVSGIPWAAYMDIQIFDKPAPLILPLPDNGGFVSSLPNFNAQSPYPTEASTQIFPLNLLRSSSGKVASVRWTAHLPEFHNFWDDRAPAGIDAEDSQQLRLQVDLNGATVETFGKSQHPLWPTYGPSRQSWTAADPVQVDSADDLRLTLSFKNAQTLPPGSRNAVFATPLVESVEVTMLTAPQYQSLQWE